MLMNPESKLYNATTLVKTPSHVVRNLGGEEQIYDLFSKRDLAKFSIGVTSAVGDVKPEAGKPVSLVKVSPLHGRSYEVRFDGEENVVWADEFGNFYSTFTTKGNNFENPYIMHVDNVPSGLSVYGLMDQDCLLRVTRASKKMASMGIETELVTGIMVPEKIPYKGKNVSQAELKEALLEDFAAKERPEELNALFSRTFSFENPPTLENARKYLDGNYFIILVRAMQVSERLDDLKQVDTREEYKMLLSKAFDFVNFTEKNKAEKDPSYVPQIFDIEKRGDDDKFLTKYLPSKLGITLATMHNAGLAHVHPVPCNTSLVGSLVDLDGVIGEPLDLGDEAISVDDKIEDVGSVFRETYSLFKHLVDKGFLIGSKAPDNYKLAKPFFLQRDFIKNFLGAYRETANEKLNLSAVAASLVAEWNENGIGHSDDFFRDLEITNLPGVDYEFKHLLGNVYRRHLKEQELELRAMFEQILKGRKMSEDDAFAVALLANQRVGLNGTIKNMIMEDLMTRSDVQALMAEIGETQSTVYIDSMSDLLLGTVISNGSFIEATKFFIGPESYRQAQAIMSEHSSPEITENIYSKYIQISA